MPLTTVLEKLPTKTRNSAAKPLVVGSPREAKPATEKPAVPYDSVDINIEVEGTYWTTVKFLEMLQTFPKMLAINEMSLRPSCTATTAASPKLNVQIAVKAVVTKGKSKSKAASKNKRGA